MPWVLGIVALWVPFHVANGIVDAIAGKKTDFTFVVNIGITIAITVAFTVALSGCATKMILQSRELKRQRERILLLEAENAELKQVRLRAK